MYRNGLPMFVLQPGSQGPVPYSASLSHPIFTTFWSPWSVETAELSSEDNSTTKASSGSQGLRSVNVNGSFLIGKRFFSYLPSGNSSQIY